MILPFDPKGELIIVPTRLWGPTGETIAPFALDTGATTSIIDPEIARFVGFDPDTLSKDIEVTTGSGVEYVSRVILKRIEAFGKPRRNFPVHCHPLPPASVDGVLGLDFFQGLRLTLDFRTGLVIVD